MQVQRSRICSDNDHEIKLPSCDAHDTKRKFSLDVENKMDKVAYSEVQTASQEPNFSQHTVLTSEQFDGGIPNSITDSTDSSSDNDDQICQPLV